MKKNFIQMPRTEIHIDAQAVTGLFEAWRHSVGQGGVNSQPLPEKVITATRNLQPRLIRIFLQEYFNIYPDHDLFNWDKLDPYMESFTRTGAKILATINLKPPILYPQIDHTIWRPNSLNEWQKIIYQLVRRYSVEKPIVTYWEHVNEPDIGTWGGCPYNIPSVEELHEFYVMTMQPVLEAFPQAKIGGPCPADYRLVPGFIDLCLQNKTRLDFVSYHRYQSDPEAQRFIANTLSQKLNHIPGSRPELMLNEWNKDFESAWSSTAYDSISIEEMAMQSRRAAHIAKIILSMMETDLDWSFYFLLWDNCMHPQEFAHFYTPEDAQAIMYKHWNEAPHRFGLFSEQGQPRPQYFVYEMLSRMGEERLSCTCQIPDLTPVAVRGDGKVSVLLVNFDLQSSRDLITKLCFDHLSPGLKLLTSYRIDDACRWSPETMELLPIEIRMVDTLPEFEYQFFSPADSVLWVTLEDMPC